jgi:D-alanyl-D-alanine carboxypeptidase/D-alanyl-D-alanine-endopeptidase (penicillin-binding protein 4)
VIGDESWFDEERRVSEWKPGLEVWCGPLSALSGNEGLHDGDPVDDPATYSAKLLTKALRKAGITIKGKPASGQVPAGALLIQRQFSAPLRALLKRQNKESDNLFAETILKGLGKDFQNLGSTDAGVLVSGATLATLDIPADTYVIQDGSGLSYGDRLTPYAIVRLLGAMYQRPDFNVFYDSLAIAGKDGTLESRMRDSVAAGNARAKTGTLNVATSLSGYVRSANDHQVAFSILVASDPIDVERANKAQDEIVVALAEAHLTGKRVLRVTPMLRQRPASSVAPVHTVGRALQPCVQP